MIKLLQKLEDHLITILFTVMVIAVFFQVLNRNILHLGLGWFEELARYCMVYVAILGAEMGLRDGSQIAVEALTSKFSPKVAHFVGYFSRLVVVAFSGVVFFASFALLRLHITTWQTSPALKVPMFVPYFALILGFGAIFISQLVIWITTLVNDIRGKGELAELNRENDGNNDKEVEQA